MANFVSNGPCPACGSKDNRASYDDGSAWCWGCHHYTPPTRSGFVTQALEQDEDESITLPSDLSRDYPEQVINFVGKYSITIEELIRNDYFWSEFSSRLWRTYCGDDGESLAIAAEGRWLGSAMVRHSGTPPRKQPPKSIFKGNKEQIFAICQTPTHQQEASTRLVLVEDSLSSIKVGRCAPAMPLFGTHISPNKIAVLKQRFGVQEVIVWLDHDKFKEGWEIANKFKWLGIGAKVVLTDDDPKCYNEEQITEYIK